METIRVVTGETINILFEILNGGLGVTGESPTIEIIRESDGEYWEGTGSTWEVAVQSNNMAEYDATNEEGLYNYSFTFLATEDTYIVHKINTGVNAQDEYVYYIATELARNDLKNVTESEHATTRGKIDTLNNIIRQILRR